MLPTSRPPPPPTHTHTSGCAFFFLRPLFGAWARQAALLRWGSKTGRAETHKGSKSHPPTHTPPTVGLVLAAVTGRAEIRSGVSPWCLFLVVCPHALLCLDPLTTGSCAAATFQPAASFPVSNFSHARRVFAGASRQPACLCYVGRGVGGVVGLKVITAASF